MHFAALSSVIDRQLIYRGHYNCVTGYSYQLREPATQCEVMRFSGGGWIGGPFVAVGKDCRLTLCARERSHKEVPLTNGLFALLELEARGEGEFLVRDANNNTVAYHKCDGGVNGHVVTCTSTYQIKLQSRGRGIAWWNFCVAIDSEGILMEGDPEDRKITIFRNCDDLPVVLTVLWLATQGIGW